MRRVVITGAGALTPHGDLPSTIEAVRRGAAPPLASIYEPADWGARVAAVPEFDPRPYFRAPKAMKVADRRTRMLIAAASMALADARIDSIADPERAAVMVGTSGSDLQAQELSRALRGVACDDITCFAENLLARLNPLWLLVNLPNMAAGHVSIQFGFRGPNNTIMTDWIAGLQAIGEAFDLIRSGEADTALAGGAETALLPFALAALAAAGLLEDGFIAGEGAAMVVLEEEQRARERGARIHGEIVGYGSSAASLEDCLRSAAVPGERRSVIAGGATRAQRAAEKDAVKAVFGGAVVESMTPFTGHALGASGAVSLALASIQPRDEDTVYCNSVGFLGQSATIAFRPHGV